MEKIQLVLVDDELSSRNTIKKYLEENDTYEIIADFQNGKTALYLGVTSSMLGNRVPVRRSTGFSSYRCWSRGASGFRILPVLIYTSCSLYLEFRIF